MRTAVALCVIFSITANSQQSVSVNKISAIGPAYTDTPIKKPDAFIPPNSRKDSYHNLPPCKGNGIVTFTDSSSQPLWLYYWYAEDVANASNECHIRRFWKQLDAGDNTFSIPKNKTLIFRICTGTQCSKSLIRQYGIVHYCSVMNERVVVH